MPATITAIVTILFLLLSMTHCASSISAADENMMTQYALGVAFHFHVVGVALNYYIASFDLVTREEAPSGFFPFVSINMSSLVFYCILRPQYH